MKEQGGEIESLKERVSCAALLEQLAPVWRLDRAQSTRRSRKYRRDPGEILIVSHGGRGWWDPLGEAKGNVFTLARHLDPGLLLRLWRRSGELVALLAPRASPCGCGKGRLTAGRVTRWRQRGSALAAI